MSQQTKLPQPPKWLDKLLEQFCASHLLEEVQGDLHERFYLRVQRRGEASTKKLYVGEVLSYIRLSVFKRKPSIKLISPYVSELLKNCLEEYGKAKILFLY